MGQYENTLAKCQIINLDGGHNVALEALYNPNQITCDKQVPWQSHAQARQEFLLEFTGAQPAKLSVELFFDTYEDKKSVYELYISKLEELTVPRSHSDEIQRRPPLCMLEWGNGFPPFKGVVESLNVKYTMFLHNGVPVRATASIALTRTDHAVRRLKNRISAPKLKLGLDFDPREDESELSDRERTMAGLTPKNARRRGIGGTNMDPGPLALDDGRNRPGGRLGFGNKSHFLSDRPSPEMEQKLAGELTPKLTEMAQRNPLEFARLMRDKKSMTKWVRDKLFRSPLSRGGGFSILTNLPWLAIFVAMLMRNAKKNLTPSLRGRVSDEVG